MKRKLLLLSLIPVATVVYFIATIGWVIHHGKADNDLLRSIKADKTDAALAALHTGANPNIRDRLDQVNYWTILRGGNPQNRELDERYATPLQIALSAEIEFGIGPGPNHIHRENPVLIKALLDHGADPNDTVMRGTPLMRAAEWEYADTLKLLLDKGAKVNTQDASGRTALHYAIMLSRVKTECVRLLLERGADPDIKEGTGQTSRQLAEISHSKEIQELLRNAKPKR